MLLAGAAGSVALMLRAGSRQRSALLIVLFTGWVLSPFLALALASLRSQAWTPRGRQSIHLAMIAVACLSLAVYGLQATVLPMKAGFAYLVVPAGGWVLIALVLAAGRLASRAPR